MIEKKDDLMYDVLICGGGPGGSTCAMKFKGTGLKVAVIEKSAFPREKVCGDGLAPYIPKTLDRIDPVFGEAFRKFSKKFPVPRIRVSAANRKAHTFDFPESFFISTRYEFDNFLYEQASALPNVTYYLNSQVSEVSVSDSHAEVKTADGKTLRGKLLIGCDGATSLVRRSLTNYTVNHSQYLPAIRAYYENVSDIQKDTIEIFFYKEHPVGYLWIFPSYGNMSNIGFGIMSDHAIKNKISLRDEMLRLIEITPELKTRFANATLSGKIEGWSIPFGYNSHPISGNRFMLVGDAASVADPSSGEGIGLAMVSGRIAGEHALRCAKENNYSASFMKGYDVEMEKKFGKLLRKREWLAHIMAKYPWMMNLFINTMNASSFMKKIIVPWLFKLSQ